MGFLQELGLAQDPAFPNSGKGFWAFQERFGVPAGIGAGTGASQSVPRGDTAAHRAHPSVPAHIQEGIWDQQFLPPLPPPLPAQPRAGTRGWENSLEQESLGKHGEEDGKPAQHREHGQAAGGRAARSFPQKVPKKIPKGAGKWALKCSRGRTGWGNSLRDVGSILMGLALIPLS